MRKHLVSMLIAVCFSTGQASCAPSTQSKALTASFITLDAATLGFEQFDKQHEAHIRDTCTSTADCAAQHARYDAQLVLVNKAFKAATDALIAANKLETDQTVAGAVTAAASLWSILTNLGVTL